MKTIHKFVLTLASEQVILLNEGAKPLTVDMQYDRPCLWAEVDTDKPKVPTVVRMFGTGSTLPDNPGNPGKYLGTVYPTEYLVLHYYINGDPELCTLC